MTGLDVGRWIQVGLFEVRRPLDSGSAIADDTAKENEGKKRKYHQNFRLFCYIVVNVCESEDVYS